MKLKSDFIIICLFVFLFSNQVNGQIDKELKTYVDSTEIQVNNGRKMLINLILDKNYPKAREIYNYLTNLTSGKTFSAFYYSEDIYLNILFGDWKNLTEILLNFKNLGNKHLYQNSFEIYSVLGNTLRTVGDSLQLECQKADIDNESKELIGIILYVIKNGSKNDVYNTLLKDFQKQYGHSRYSDVITNVLPRKSTKGSFGFGLGSGLLATYGKLKDYFGPNASFNLSIDFNIQKVYTSFYLNGSSLKLKLPFSASNGTDTLSFSKDESFQYLDAGLRCGYFVIRNGRINFAPYLSVSGSFLQSKRYGSNDDDREFKVFNSFTCGPGVHADIKLADLKVSNMYNYYGISHSYVSIRIDGGYNFITKFKDNSFRGNTPYITVGLTWGLGDF